MSTDSRGAEQTVSVALYSYVAGEAAQLREYCPRAFGTWAIFPPLREISLTIDLDASHYLHINIHHVMRFEPITAAHFDQRYNNMGY